MSPVVLGGFTRSSQGCGLGMSLLWAYPGMPGAACWGSPHIPPRDPLTWGWFPKGVGGGGSGCWGPKHGGVGSQGGWRSPRCWGSLGWQCPPPPKPPGSSQVSPCPLQSLPVTSVPSSGGIFHPLQCLFLGTGGHRNCPNPCPQTSQGRPTGHGHPQATDHGDTLVSPMSEPILGTPWPEVSPGDLMPVSPITWDGDTGHCKTPGQWQLSASGRGHVGAPSCAGWSGPG